MKKVLAIALTLTLVFALAVSSSAASLASTWTDIWNLVDPEQAGEVIVNEDGSILLDNSAGAWHTKIGLAYADKVAVDGLEMVVVLDNIFAGADCIWLPAVLAQYLSVNLTAEKPDAFVAYTDAKNPMGGFATGLNFDPATGAALTFTLNGDASTFAAFGGMASAIQVAYDAVVGSIADGSDLTIKFVVDGENVKILFNGTESGLTFAAADVLDADGKAYLSFVAASYGGANANMTVKTINGQAANAFVPAANTPAGPADIEVIAIAGAMIVALMAAAFVVKARKA